MTTIVTIDMGGTSATHAAGAREALSVPSTEQMGHSYAQANSARDQANTAYGQANAAYAAANTRVLKAGDTMTGNLNVAATLITQNVVPDANVIYDLGAPTKRFKDLYLSNSTIYIGETTISASGDEMRANTFNAAVSFLSAGLNVLTQANTARTQANSAYGQANAAYGQANTARSDANTTFATINTTFATTNTIDATQNTWISNLNSAASTINTSLSTINTSFGTLNTTFGTTNTTFGTVNTNITNTNSNAVNAYAQANSAYGQANSAYGAANTRLSASGGTLSGDLIITGNLTVSGNQTILNTEVLTTEDADIVLLSNTSSTPALNAGLIVNRGTSSNTFLRWNEVTDKWGYSDDGTIFYSLDDIRSGLVTTNTTFGTVNTSLGTINTSLGTINTNYQAAYAQANTARGTANDAYGQANAAYTRANTKLDSAGGTVSGNLTVTGSLTVSGNVSSINTQSISSVSNEIILNSNASGAPSLDGKLTVNRGSSSNVTLIWNEATDKWGWTDNGATYYSFEDLRSGLATHNTTFGTVNTTFGTVNTSLGTINTNYQAAYAQANTARSDANTTFATVNTTFGTVNTTFATINTNYQAAYAQANTARSDANTTFATVNTTFGTINTTFATINTTTATMNTATTNRVLKAGDTMTGQLNISSGGLLVTGNVNMDSGTLFVDSVNDRIGIGTTSPYSRLTLVTDSATNGMSMFTSAYIGAQNWGTRIWKNDTGGGIPLQIENQYVGTWYTSVRMSHGQSNDHPSLRSYYTTQLATDGGNVGIGTTSPSQKLEVGYFLDAVTNRITVAARYEYEPEFNFRLGQSGTNYDWVGGIISCGDDGNYNGKILFKTANAGRDTPTTKMTIKASGNVGIGTTSPAEKLHVVGNMVATGSITASYSDARFKDIISNIQNPLEIISRIDAIYYRPNELVKSKYPEQEDRVFVGVTAQSVKEVLPEVVVPSPIDPEYDTVHYDRLVPVLIAAIQEQQKQIDELKSKLGL